MTDRRIGGFVFRLAGCLLLWTVRAVAHDYWLESTPPRGEVGGEAMVQLMFGEDFASGAPKPLQLRRTGDFRLYGQSRRYKDLLKEAEDAREPVVRLQLQKEGVALVAMERTAASVIFGRAKFLENAAAEGYAIAENELPVTKRRVRETYSRYLKTLVRVGEGGLAQGASRVVGQRYEILPETTPFGIGVSSLRVKVLFDGEPASGVKVTAAHRLNGRLSTTSRTTDRRGQCELPLAQTGRWLFRSVKMVPEGAKEGPVAGYRSYWAVLTFGYD